MATVVSGCVAFQVCQSVITDGIGSSVSPSSGPRMAWPRMWLQRLSVSMSIITRLRFQRNPETQKFRVRSPTRRAYTMPLWQRCHHVAAMARSPSESLRISRRGPVSMLIG